MSVTRTNRDVPRPSALCSPRRDQKGFSTPEAYVLIQYKLEELTFVIEKA